MNEPRPFFKGSFPSWLTTALIAISAYFGQMLIRDMREDIRALRVELVTRNERVAVLEVRSENMGRDFNRMQQSIDNLANEVRALRQKTP